MPSYTLIADGIYQIRLPLPFPLNIVHAYLLEDADGWTVVDAGLHYPAGCAVWNACLHDLGIDRSQIQRVVLTHCHPDHYGAAGWLTETSAAPVYCSQREHQFAQFVWQSQHPNELQTVELFRSHGLPTAIAEVISQDIAALREMTQPAPQMMLEFDLDLPLVIGKRQFELIHTAGHSDGHVVLYSRADQLVLCGDAVLAQITPNVGLWSWSNPNPLADFLAGLDRLSGLDVRLALPGHKKLITDWQGRIDQLRQHHEQRLQLAEQLAGRGADGFTICNQLFDAASLNSHQFRFAMAEALAHLEYLVSLGRLRRVAAGYAQV